MAKPKSNQLKAKIALAEIQRELAIRKVFYAKQIRTGKMDRDLANSQYIALEYAKELVLDYIEKQAPQGNLFEDQKT